MLLIVGDAVPDGEFCRHLIDGGGRDQTSTPGIKIEAAQGTWGLGIGKRGWEVSVQSSAHDITTHDDLVAAPCVIGPSAIARERSREIAGGESDHVIRHSEAIDRILKTLEGAWLMVPKLLFWLLINSSWLSQPKWLTKKT